MDIEAPAVPVAAGIFHPTAERPVSKIRYPLGLGRPNAAATDGGMEQTTDSEGGVANVFSGQAQARLAGQHRVHRVACVKVTPCMGGLAVRGRQR